MITTIHTPDGDKSEGRDGDSPGGSLGGFAVAGSLGGSQGVAPGDSGVLKSMVVDSVF